MKYQIENLYWDFCSQECLRRNACNSTDIVIKNLRACACCSALNLELLVVLSGGPLPEKKHQMITLNPTVRTVGQEIEIRGQREEPRQHTNGAFYEFIRRRRSQLGHNVDAQVLAQESAYLWRIASEEEKAMYEEPSIYSTHMSF